VASPFSQKAPPASISLHSVSKREKLAAASRQFQDACRHDPAVLDDFRRRTSKGTRRYWRSPAGREEIRRRHAQAGQGRSELHSRTWEIVRQRILGHPLKEIARDLGIHLHAARYHCALVGLPTNNCGPFLGDFGEAVSGRLIRELRKNSGLSWPEFDDQIGLSKNQGYNLLPKMHVPPPVARGIIAWPDAIIREVFSRTGNSGKVFIRPNRPSSKPAFLKRILPHLPEKYGLLRKTLPVLRRELKDHPDWTVADIGAFVCRQARMETHQQPRRHHWRILLCWLPQLEESLAQSLERLRSRKFVHEIAADLIGSRYRISGKIIMRAMDKSLKPMSVRDMRDLIRNRGIPTEKLKSPRPRRKPGRMATTRAKITVAADRALQNWTEYRTASILFPKEEDRQSAYDKTKQLFRRHGPEIETEKLRLTALSDNERIVQVSSAEQALN
jgi:predicted DNA-binding transcriptional regulator AlpA/DNA-binding CsgD family transcriptional regulator